MRLTCFAVFAALCSTAVSVAETPKTFHPVPATANPDLLGRGVQRTMTLLATSTPEHRNKVRILVYGQSISEQDWWKHLADDLRKRFPNADIDIQNRAIGGFASQLLIRPAEHDLYPFYPDLLIFHVYGANQEYESIIKSVRSRTAAEVLMQRDHATFWPPEKPDPNVDKGKWWDNMMNHHFLPDIAKKYHCGLVDVRGGWLDYLKANKLQPQDLLKDGVHLNDHGNYLMAKLIGRYLVYRPELPKDDWETLSTTHTVDAEAAASGTVKITFDGNRVDLLPNLTAAPGRVTVRIDGKKPSEFPGAYAITRPTPGPWSPLFLARVDHVSQLLVEDWTLTVSDVSPDTSKWTFTVVGSKTGPDGSGESDKPFASTSGRVKIDPAAWFKPNKELKNGYTVKWSVVPMFQDEYVKPSGAWDRTLDNAVTVVQGISNGEHVIELKVANGAVPVNAVRTYRPPVR